jgi:hypothetical protein
MPDSEKSFTRAETHAALLETAAALLEADGIGLDPDQGHVTHLRRMAGSIRAQAAIGRLAQRYGTDRYLPEPPAVPGPGGLDAVVSTGSRSWH